MSTLKVEVQPVASDLEFTDAEMLVTLVDGRSISIPLAWFPSLSNASKEQREDFRIIGDGEGIHWPQLDEDLSVKGLLYGFH
jgi:hypothetical protein